MPRSQLSRRSLTKMRKNTGSISNSKKNNLVLFSSLFDRYHDAGSSFYQAINTLNSVQDDISKNRARGLVGYDVALTRRRSPVRIRPGPLRFFSGSSFRTEDGFAQRSDKFHLSKDRILMLLSDRYATLYRKSEILSGKVEIRIYCDRRWCNVDDLDHAR